MEAGLLLRQKILFSLVFLNSANITLSYIREFSKLVRLNATIALLNRQYFFSTKMCVFLKFRYFVITVSKQKKEELLFI